MNTNVIPLPQLSEIDKQYLLLEKQRKEILEQRKLIDERKL
jgi:hypothetical protein